MIFKHRLALAGSASALIVMLLANGQVLGVRAQSRPAAVPVFEVNAFWPKIPEKILLGPVRGVAVDAQDHIWIHQDSNSIVKDELEAALDPPLAECCVPGPTVMEFDASGKYIQGW